MRGNHRRAVSVGTLIVALCGFWAVVWAQRPGELQTVPSVRIRPSAASAADSLGLQFDGHTIRLMEATGLESETEVMELRQGADNLTRKLPGRHRTSKITLTYAALQPDPVLAWRQAVVEGKVMAMRKTIAIVMTKGIGKETFRFTVRNAWPSRYAYSFVWPTLDDIYASVAVTLEHDGIEFPK